jgi:type III restriction enzyme
MNYDPDPETKLLPEEFVDVYGIPFSVIPFKGRPVDKATPEDKPKNHVCAIDDRADMEIRFPVVEGYVFALTRNVVKCDVDGIEPLSIDPKLEPTTTFLRLTAGYLDSDWNKIPFDFVEQDRDEYYQQTHLQTILFQLTHRVVDELLSPTRGQDDTKTRVMRLKSRHQLFPQVFRFVQEYVQKRVNFNGVDERELGLEKYTQLVVERLRDSIHPDEASGEAPLLPVLNRYKPHRGTAAVDFTTMRPVVETKKSHINSVVQHSTWEGDTAQVLESDEANDIVVFYARNDHLGPTIPYEYLEATHSYEPDFLVRLSNGVTVILEIKGYEFDNTEQINHKHSAAKKWVAAVNNLGDFGRWDFVVCRDVGLLLARLEALARQDQPAAVD